MRGRTSLIAIGAAVAALIGAGLPAVAQTFGDAQMPPPLPAQAQVQLDGGALTKFMDPLPVLYVPGLTPPAGIPVALGNQMTLSMCEFQTRVLPPDAAGVLNAGATGLTSVWGYRIGECPTGGPLTDVGDSYIGPVVIAERGVPTEITFRNMLGHSADTNVLAYKNNTDLTMMWADPLSMDVNGLATVDPVNPLPWSAPHTGGPFLTVPPPEDNYCSHAAVAGQIPSVLCANNYFGPIPAAPHLHGGEVPAVLDGGPDAWWTQSGIYGHGYYSRNGFADSSEVVRDANGNPVLGPDGLPIPAGQAVYTYPNTQEAAPIWFHDHVLGATRLNVYAGIAGAYMVTEPDPGKTVLDQSSKLAAGLLPLGLDTDGSGSLLDVAGVLSSSELLVPVVLQDRAFDTNGELFFHGAGFNSSITHPFWVPEFVGDTIAVNGKAWPHLEVAPKRYRFLFINGSNARAYELMLVDSAARTKVHPVQGVSFKLHPKDVAVTQPMPSMWVIGNDQGYLDTPVEIPAPVVNVTTKKIVPAANNKLVIMPGERYEVIIDFANLPLGTLIEMRNSGAIPYPFGDPVIAGLDDTIMQFRVNLLAPVPTGACGVGVADCSYNPATLGPIRVDDAGALDPITRLVDAATGTVSPGVEVHKVRRLTLNEAFDPVTLAPVALFMNNTTYIGEGNTAGSDLPRTPEFDDVTTRWNTSYYSELPFEGETEVWEIINFSADAHPIHPHLVAYQILNRQPFDAIGYQAAYEAAFPSRTEIINGVPTLVTGYDPGAGPPLNYNMSDGTPNLYNIAAATQPCGPTPPLAGVYECALGGNPDPTPFLTLGPAVPPLASEQGWKDTAISYPGEILRLLIRFAPPHVAAGTPSTDPSAAYAFSPAEGHGYVWHCHIIDHEDNEMMRPWNVTANAATDALGPRPIIHGVHY